MTHTRPDGPWLGMGAVVLGLALAAACAPKAARRQTEIMEKTGKVHVGAVLLRARVNDLADRWAARIERTADRIAAGAPDPAMRRRALVLKVDAIPAVYAAAYRADPLTAVMDLWGFAIQFEQYFADGAGRDAFGSQQEMIRQCAREMIADADALTRSIATLPEHFERAPPRWRRGPGPIRSTTPSRRARRGRPS